MIKLYQFTECPYCEKVRQKLAQLGLKYEKIEVDYVDKPEIVIKHNQGRVPVLDDSGEIIVESSIIVEYLESKYGKHQSPANK